MTLFCSIPALITYIQYLLNWENQKITCPWIDQHMGVKSEARELHLKITHLWPWSTKPVKRSTGIFIAIASTIHWMGQNYRFFFAKNPYEIMFHEDILYISYSKYIKTFEWFSQYLDFFAASDSRFSNSCISATYCPIITNHTSM